MEKKKLIPFTKPFVICALLGIASFIVFLLLEVFDFNDPLYLSELRGIPLMFLVPVCFILLIGWLVSFFRKNENTAKLKSVGMVAICTFFLVFAAAVLQTSRKTSTSTMYMYTEMTDGQAYLVHHDEKIRLSSAQYDAITRQGEGLHESCMVDVLTIPLLCYTKLTYFEDSNGNVIK